MDNKRKMVDEMISFTIRPTESYKSIDFCTWEDLMKIDGIIPSDVIVNFYWETGEGTKFGGYEEGEQDSTHYTPMVTVKRRRLENDKEFELRMLTEAKKRQKEDEEDKLEYLRLKAKFENNE